MCIVEVFPTLISFATKFLISHLLHEFVSFGGLLVCLLVFLFWFSVLSRMEQVQKPGNLEKYHLVALYENHK